MIYHSERNDSIVTVSFFKKEVEKFVEERNWVDFQTPKNLIQAIQIEAAELSELFLFKDYNRETIVSDEKLRNDISEEVADVFIYLISLVNSIDIDLTQAFIRKMKINHSKYPKEEFVNGNYYKK